MLLETNFEPAGGLTAAPRLHLNVEQGVPLGQLLAALRARKGLLIAVTVAGAILSATAAMLLPVQYSAQAVIMPPQQDQSVASAVLGQLGGMGSLGERGLGLKSPSDIYVGIAKSRTVVDAIIGRFHLQAIYGEDSMEDTRRHLQKVTEIESGKDTLIKISVEDHEARRAAVLANAYVEELYRQNSHLALTESAQRRLFFEHELTTERDALGQAEEALKDSQQHTGMLQVNTQVEVAIRSIAELQAAIAEREIALKRLAMGATENNPEVIQLNTELAGMREQLRRLETTRSRPGNPLIATSNLPQMGLDYVRLLRELQYHETLFELLAKQFEAAKIDEAKQAPVIQIVDQAIPLDKKVWPPRGLLIVVGTLTALFAACALVLLRAWIPAAVNG